MSSDAQASTSAITDDAPAELWNTILREASSSKATPQKQLVVLGEPETGKTTLLHMMGVDRQQAPTSSTNSQHLDLALSFDYLDVRDEGEEEAIARVGVYQVASSNPPYSAMLPLALAPSTLLDSLCVILLDWERPWTFISHLTNWFSLLHKTKRSMQEEKSSKEGERVEYLLELGKERLESTWRSYQEPKQEGSSLAMSASGGNTQIEGEEIVPLPPGTLLENLSIPIVVVVTKADQVDVLEKEKYFKEEQFDYIQQALRTICLRYGAGLFFVSRNQTASVDRLKSYLLHRLFSVSSPVPSSSSANDSQAQQRRQVASTRASRAFPFTHRANVVDRDGLIIPTGWDSWGKIGVLREGFDPYSIGEAWQRDVALRVDPTSASADDGPGLGKIWQQAIVNYKVDDRPSAISQTRVKAQDEQDFLRMHFELLSKEAAKDPRSHFSRPSASLASPSIEDAGAAFSPGVVGPMSSSSLSLPSVAKALERDADDRKPIKESTSSAARGPISPTFGAASPSLGNGNVTPAETLRNKTTTPGTPGTQNEVLANFFQSLLSARKDPNKTGTPRAESPRPPQNGT